MDNVNGLLRHQYASVFSFWQQYEQTLTVYFIQAPVWTNTTSTLYRMFVMAQKNMFKSEQIDASHVTNFKPECIVIFQCACAVDCFYVTFNA